MTPQEALKIILFRASNASSNIDPNKPGALIEKMSSEIREALQNISSEDLKEIFYQDKKYFDCTYRCFDVNWFNKDFLKDKLNFDKEVLGK